METINPLIIVYGQGYLGCEDKCIGAFFVKLLELQDKEYFSEKVLMYLWNDAFKYEHDKIFKEEYRTLDELLAGFKQVGFEIFADGVKFKKIIDMINGQNKSDDDTK